MRRLVLAGLGSILLVACYGNVYGDEYETCEELDVELKKELHAIQSCATSAECGEVLEGTSCGCTNDLVARIDADASRYNSLRARGAELACSNASDTCDCPNAKGFVCTDGVCGWNYVK